MLLVIDGALLVGVFACSVYLVALEYRIRKLHAPQAKPKYRFDKEAGRVPTHIEDFEVLATGVVRNGDLIHIPEHDWMGPR
jgi:hypothetical protein